jgi:spore coat protein A
MISRRQFFKLTAAVGAGLAAPWSARLGNALPVGALRAFAVPAAAGLSDPASQPKFVEYAPNALAPGFIYEPNGNDGIYRVAVKQITQMTGLRKNGTGKRLPTTVWGYGDEDIGFSWPGRTFQVQSGASSTMVQWKNELYDKKGNPLPHLLAVDTNLHWAYSLPGYTGYNIQQNGVPIITHLHGGHTDYRFDGNPEFFYSPDNKVIGPQWGSVPGGFTNTFTYDNDVPAGNLWYHDHALGITRLNVYAGLAGFYFVRDGMDTGQPDNPLGLPAFPYELAYAIQDRMFLATGELFYPAFPGDPFYEEFITGEVELPPGLFPGGGPTALAEFFGDHMVVNGKIWPKEDVRPRNYRMRLLNGTDSRFMVIQFVAVDAGVDDPKHESASGPLPFYVIGSDQGLGRPAGSPTQRHTLVFEPGGRYDIVFDFKGLQDKRVIMKNIGGDAPFGGDYGNALEPEDLFPSRQTDRIMAFDVIDVLNEEDSFDPAAIPVYGGVANGATTRRVALFEGTDEFGRLQPLLGTVADGDLNGTNVATAYTWFQPTTETPAFDSTEIWEIYNFTADAHPVHLHLVNFEILDRKDFEYDVTGVQTTTQHNNTTGEAPEISNIRNLTPASAGPEYFEDAPKDMVTSLPGDPEGEPPTGQMVRIKAHFDKNGRYVWHCHILSHEDHEMMRVLQVG